MSGSRWRILHTATTHVTDRVDAPATGPLPAGTGAENMAVDQVLLESVQAGGPPTLRFYRWSRPCLSLGRNQPAQAAVARRAARRGWDLVRRPTGGAAVLHHHELTYAAALPIGLLGSPRRSYAAINRALLAGLAELGVAGEMVPDDLSAGSAGAAPSAQPPASAGTDAFGTVVAPSGAPVAAAAAVERAAAAAFEAPASAAVAVGPLAPEGACFRRAAPGEVVAGGRKLIGSAQRCERRCLLQHGSILLDGDQSGVRSVLGGSAGGPADTPGPVTSTLAELLGEIPRWDVLVSALCRGFQRTLGIAFAPGSLTSAERARVRELAERFRAAAWTWRR